MSAKGWHKGIRSLVFFAAWIDQNQSDFMKSRSVALSAVKDALEKSGFALPEPIYRLRFDPASGPLVGPEPKPLGRETPASAPERPIEAPAVSEDVAPETDIVHKVEEERSGQDKEDLLNYNAPVE